MTDDIKKSLLKLCLQKWKFVNLSEFAKVFFKETINNETMVARSRTNIFFVNCFGPTLVSLMCVVLTLWFWKKSRKWGFVLSSFSPFQGCNQEQGIQADQMHKGISTNTYRDIHKYIQGYSQIYTGISINKYRDIHKYIQGYPQIYTGISTNIYRDIHKYIHTYPQMYTGISTNTYRDIHKYIQVYPQIHTHISTNIYRDIH